MLLLDGAEIIYLEVSTRGASIYLFCSMIIRALNRLNNALKVL
jgi:hypothetical protein